MKKKPTKKEIKAKLKKLKKIKDAKESYEKATLDRSLAGIVMANACKRWVNYPSIVLTMLNLK